MEAYKKTLSYVSHPNPIIIIIKYYWYYKTSVDVPLATVYKKGSYETAIWKDVEPVCVL